MAAFSFTSLRDMLDQPPSQNSNLLESLFSQPNAKAEIPHDDPYVTEMFGELYFRESSSSTLHFLFPPSSDPLPNPTPKINVDIEKESEKTNLEKEKSDEKHDVTKPGCIYNKSPSENKEERLFPPPISSLKLAKGGKPFIYSRFDENSGRFVRKEIRIPTQGLLCASRENGRLKLNFAREEEEDEDEAVEE